MSSLRDARKAIARGEALLTAAEGALPAASIGERIAVAEGWARLAEAAARVASVENGNGGPGP